MLALDRKTGKTVWKTDRKYGIRSYVTPLIRKIDGGPRWSSRAASTSQPGPANRQTALDHRGPNRAVRGVDGL
ncbi:MAG: hypothetical protein CM1200mP2_39720 [Planctomycetaceae bacterium]|nr:MAG: hypothetical protein CM1200mP2_39720 [Planctomycetaceae bacterium]